MPDHKELIALDFDHTLFNTTRFVDDLSGEFERQFNIPMAEFLRQRDAVKACCVVEDIDIFVNKLPHDDKTAMHATIHSFIKQHSREYVFADAADFFARHRQHFDFLYITRGDKELQHEKIAHSGLPTDIPMEIGTEAKPDVLAPYANQYQHLRFIDDKAENINMVKEVYQDRVTTYFMSRLEDMPYDTPPKPENVDRTVSGLDFTLTAQQ